MRGSLRERPPGSGIFELRVYAGVDVATGKKRWATRTVRGKRNAERELAKLVTKMTEGRHGGQSATFDALLDRWLEHLSDMGRSPTTLAGYRQKLVRVRHDLGAIRLHALGPEQLDRYYARRLRSGEDTNARRRTIHHEHRVMAAALHQAVRWGWIDRSPADRASPPRVRQAEIAKPEVEEVWALLDAAQASRTPERAPLLAFMAFTGCRRGEACGLRWSDVDLADGTITIRRAVIRDADRLVERTTKTGRVRTLAVGDLGTALMQARRAYVETRARGAEVLLASDAYVWSDDADGLTPLRPDTISQFTRRLCSRLGMPELHLHSFRHFAATELVSEDFDVRTVAGRLGHGDPSMTLRVYAGFRRDRDRAAADLLSRRVLRELPPSPS